MRGPVRIQMTSSSEGDRSRSIDEAAREAATRWLRTSRTVASGLARRATGRSIARQSALILEIPEAEPLLRAARLKTSQGGLGPHVTILYPFLDPRSLRGEVHEQLAEICRARPALPLRFPAVGRFPGHTHLPVTPPDDCVELTNAVTRRWPEAQPYGGAYTTVIPHLTVMDGQLEGRDLELLEGRLPLETAADALICMVNNGFGWRRLWRIPFHG